MKKNNRGFTLIELIITVTVIMVLVGVGSMSLSNFNGIKELEAAREQVSNHLKLARNLAITKQLPNESDVLKYVRVSLSGNNIVAEGISINGVGVTTFYNQSPYSTMTINTNSDIGVSFVNSFGFMKSSGRLTDVGGNLVGTTMTVEVSRGAIKKTININSLGSVSNVN